MKPGSSNANRGTPGPRFCRASLIAAGGLLVAAALYLGVCAFAVSSSLTPKPSACTIETPFNSGLAFEEVHFESDVDRIPLAGWLLSSTGDRAIVLVHGLDSTAWSNDKPDVARAYVEAGFHVLLFDLRGHGPSGGDRLGLGWDERRDVRAAVNLLLGRGFKPGTIGVHGTSYGAAVALLAAAAIPEIGAVVADSAFADMREVMDREIKKRTGLPTWLVRRLRPGLAVVANLLYGLDFDVIPPERAVPSIAPRSILFIHGREDRTIPVGHTYRLKAASENPTDELWLLPGGHTEGVRLLGKPCEAREPSPTREAYLKKVTAFFDRALASPGLAPTLFESRNRRMGRPAGARLFRWLADWEDALKRDALRRARVPS